MNWWQRVRHRWRMEDELDAELRFHFDHLVSDYRAAGLSEADARQRARAEFGGVEELRDACRDARGTRWVHDVGQDVRFSARLLSKERGFTVVAVLALALGIGVNNAMFTIVNALCLHGLPIEEPDRVVDIAARDEAGRAQPLAHREFDELKAGRSHALEDVAAYVNRPAAVRDETMPADRINLSYISANALSLIRQQPFLGRDFRPDDDRPGRATVVLLGADLWHTRYSADPGIIGRFVTINGTPAAVVGVMPEGFRFPDNADAWQPLSALNSSEDVRIWRAYGRLAAGATPAQAQDGITAILQRQSQPSTRAIPGGAIVMPINERYLGRITDPAWLAFITAGLLLVLIACSNVANLLLARGVRRAHEIAIRLSLGATRSRIVRQLLVESAMLTALSGVVAVGISIIGLRVFSAAIPEGGLPYWVRLTFDARVVLVLFAVCTGTVLVSGVAPALQLARTNLNSTMKEAANTTSASPGARRWTWVFLTLQLAFTVIMLSGVGITVQSFYLLRHRGPSIDAKHILTFGITLPAEAYRAPEQRLAFYRSLQERVTGAERAVAVSVASALPASAGQPREVIPDGRDGTAPVRVRANLIDDRYFTALGLPLLAGRAFTRDEGAAGRMSIIVNQRFAEMFLPRGNAVGQLVRLRAAPGSPGPVDEIHTVVGVTSSMRQQPTLEPDPLLYLPLPLSAMSSVVVLVRAKHEPAALAPAVREIARQIDPNVPLYRVMTLERASWEGRWNARVSAGIISTLAFIALALATVGLAALTAHAVAQRSRELGIRLALGAARREVVLLVLRRVLLQVTVGLIFGAIGAKGWERLFGGAGVTTMATLGIVSLLVVCVTMGVSAWPAARAARIDPLLMLRDH
jgi:putative ABC transport system permease protein